MIFPKGTKKSLAIQTGRCHDKGTRKTGYCPLPIDVADQGVLMFLGWDTWIFSTAVSAAEALSPPCLWQTWPVLLLRWPWTTGKLLNSLPFLYSSSCASDLFAPYHDPDFKKGIFLSLLLSKTYRIMSLEPALITQHHGTDKKRFSLELKKKKKKVRGGRKSVLQSEKLSF